MKRIVLLIAFIISVSVVKAQLHVNYYVTGDADDWQLFMSQNLITDLDVGRKAVIITLTAGDGGNGATTFNGSSVPYYIAKELGSVYTSKFVADLNNRFVPAFPALTYPVPTITTANINGKSIAKYVYGNPSGVGSTVNYFLRLPDGGSSGDGFPGTGNKSLKKLKNGSIANITSVDGVTTYTWNELLTTIYSIINLERATDPQVWVNCASLNPVTNPNDYPDHFYSSTAAQEAISTSLWIGINEYIMDHSSTLGNNLDNEPYQYSTGTFNVYNWNLIKNKYPSQFNSTVRAWLGKEYLSITRSPTGSGPLPITLLTFTGTLKGNNVLLDWTTSSEINSKEFQIEKSNDGVTYRKLNTVAAAGNSSINKKYSYLDVEATELNYYRLKMVDIDGYNKLSDVIIVKNNLLSQSVKPVNNPFTDHIDIRFTKMLKGPVVLNLVDISGRLIGTNTFYNPLSSVIRFDYGKTLSKGIYILRVENEGKQYSIKLVKD